MLLSIVVHCCQPPRSAMIYIVKIPYSLKYFECAGTGTDDTGMSFDGTGTGNEGTDSTSTDALILTQSYHIFTDGF